jgi:hypothetical protein
MRSKVGLDRRLLADPGAPFRGAGRLAARGALAVVLMLVVVGCGGGSPASQAPAAATATPPQPQATAAEAPTVAPISSAPAGSGDVGTCALLTLAEVSAAFGSTLDIAEPTSADPWAICVYFQSNGEDDVSVMVSTSADAAASYFATMKGLANEAVTGVGDQAFWSTDPYAPGLYFMKGSVMASISGSPDGPQDPIIQLGRLLVSRM